MIRTCEQCDRELDDDVEASYPTGPPDGNHGYLCIPCVAQGYRWDGYGHLADKLLAEHGIVE